LTELDSVFLHLEKVTTPMSVGCLALFDCATPSGPMTFDRFRLYMLDHLAVSPVFRRKVHEGFLGIGPGYWEEDRLFDLDLHLTHVRLPECSGLEALRKQCGKEFGRLLGRDRPLWEITYVSNVSNADCCMKGQARPRELFALIIRIHHAATDGVAFESILHHLFGEPESAVAAVQAAPNPALAGGQDLAAAGGTKALPAYPRRAARALRNLLGSGLEDARLRLNWRQGQVPAQHLYTAPQTPFDRPLSARRVFDSVHFPLDELRRIAARTPEAKVNDVVLTLCGTALRQYLLDLGECPRRSLVAMVPVATRSVKAATAVSGNSVSAMLVALHTHEESIAERLRAICQQTRRGKRRQGGLSLRELIDLVPSFVVARAMSAYAWFEQFRLGAPPFNLVITNIPGPQTALCLDGARLLAIEGHAPIYDGVGLILVVSSYLDRLAVSVTACPQTLTDMDHFSACLRRAFRQMRDDPSCR